MSLPVPTRRLALALVAAGCVLFVTPPAIVSSVALALVSGAFAAVLLDWTTIPSASDIAAARRVADRLSLGAENLVVVAVENGSNRMLRGMLRDVPPPEFGCGEAQSLIRVERREVGTFRYHVKPSARGRYGFGDVHLRLNGRLGLVAGQLRIPAARSVEVYPNVKAVGTYQLLARRGALLEMGIKAMPTSGRGTSFESLRDYQPDDEYRFIDWKATARAGKPITQVHEVERAQNVIIALDAGRMMTPQLEGIAKLDRAINAALMMAYVALASGDNVGLLVFGRRIQRYLAPERGRRQLRAVLEALHTVEAEMSEPDYLHALRYLAAKVRRRSLIVLFTDLFSREASRRMLTALTTLHPRHLALCVTLRDPALENLLRVRPATSTDVYIQAVGEQLLLDREDARRALLSRGALVLDAPAGEFSVSAVNKYLEVKTAGLL